MDPTHLTPPLIENLNLKLQLTGRGYTHYHYSPPSPGDSVYLGWGEGHCRNGGAGLALVSQHGGPIDPPPRAPQCPFSGLSLTMATSCPLSTLELTWKLCQPCRLPSEEPGRRRSPMNPPLPQAAFLLCPPLGDGLPQAPGASVLHLPTPESRSELQ